MKCFKCKKISSDVNKCCPRCSSVFKSEDVEKTGNSIEKQLLQVYLNKKRFNYNYSMGYLLFNFWYALYKKMYLDASFGALAYGLLVMTIVNCQCSLFDSVGFNTLLILFLIILGIVVNIYYILKFDDIYIARTKCYINNLVNDYRDEDIEFLLNKCEKDSKGDFVLPCIIVVLVIMFLLALIFKNIAFLSFCGII